MPGQADILCFATQGAGSNDDRRICRLLAPLSPRHFAFDRADKAGSGRRLLRELRRSRPDLAVMEGTGVAGGAALLAANRLWGTRFVVSSGDAVAPFVAAGRPALAPAARLYEHQLYRRCAGYIGWTPYLVGRALTWGAPRAMTAAGWAPYAAAEDRRAGIRAQLGIRSDAIVFGLVGALTWNPRVGYCYGLELVRAARLTRREEVIAVVVGDGSGRERLEREAGELLGTRILLPGAVAQSEVPAWLAAMDAMSLPQSVDGVGAFRYTTKLSEYLAAGRPVLTGEIPLAYDLDDGWLWRLPGDAPWDERYIDALARLMSTVTRGELEVRRRAIDGIPPAFDLARQSRGVVAFIEDLLSRE